MAEGPLLEIIRGDLYIVLSPSILHQRISRELSYMLQHYVKKHNLGEIFSVPVDVCLSEENFVIPDILFIAKNNKQIVTDLNIQGAPDLIVEIISSNKKRDLIEIKVLYEQYGVREYLTIDGTDQTVKYFLWDTEVLRYKKPLMLEKGDILTLQTIASLELDIQSFFESLS